MRYGGRQEMQSGHRFLNGIHLKGIGAVTMTVDHIAAVVMKGYVNARIAVIPPEQLAVWNRVYEWMRHIGRSAFPLFAFLLVEGFFRTENRRRYSFRLLFFAVLSETPFDLAFYGQAWDPKRQNVLITLFLGLVCMGLAETFGTGIVGKRKKGKKKRRHGLPAGLRFLMQCMVFLAGAGAAGLCRSDFSYKGILLIAVFYFFHLYQEAAAVAGFCVFSWSPWSFPAFLLLPFYSGKRGGGGKGRFFYCFYPLHLLALYGVLLAVKG